MKQPGLEFLFPPPHTVPTESASIYPESQGFIPFHRLLMGRQPPYSIRPACSFSRWGHGGREGPAMAVW